MEINRVELESMEKLMEEAPTSEADLPSVVAHNRDVIEQLLREDSILGD